MPAPEGNTNRQIHGGERAIKKLQKGEPFAEEVHKIYLEKLSDMGLSERDLTGVVGLLAQETSRLFTVSELFWRGMLSAADAGNFEHFEQLAKRFGWLSGKAVKSLGIYNEANKDNGALDYEKILEQERQKDG